ncbi:hypothetical protein AB0O28_19155 [Microbispora sp. NPDC088329]|uniref:hypothetical protein n=1 Tax=Microbispora sp. NPDC088329 TaxID=3154869 RepID=UPI00341338E8
MSSPTNQRDQLVVLPLRLSYGTSVVGLFRKAADAELSRADTEIATRRTAIAKIQAEIDGWERYGAEIRQAVADIEANAVQRPVSQLGATAKCGPCGAQLVRGMNGWVHAGRELVDTGHLCYSARPDSPVATPEGELSPDPDRALARPNAAYDEQDAAERGRS